MKPIPLTRLAVWGALAIASHAPAVAAPNLRFASGPDAAAIAGALAGFRADLGGVNNGVATAGGPTFRTGRREINWDAAALPEHMPANFFNNNSRRGAVFSTVGTGFLVSSNSAIAPERRFGNLNPAYVTQFTTNSPHRLFAVDGGVELTARFFVPSQPGVPATVSGFGAVFTDVDLEGLTSFFCYDIAGTLLASVTVPVSPDGGLSFAGVSFPDGERVHRVDIVCGSLPPGPTANDTASEDVVAMDDFIYGEPQPAPVLRSGTGAGAAALAGVLDAFRADLGGTNNGVAGLGGPVLQQGRREINWDAAALPEAMPPNFFNSNSRRGALFSTPGTGFLVSSNSATAPQRLFGNLKPGYPAEFTTNSPNRLFIALGSNVVDVTFTVPVCPHIPATVSGFGAVFTGVELADQTRLQYFDAQDRLVADIPVPAGPGLSFAGLSFPHGPRIARVRVFSGNHPLDEVFINTEYQDVVAMDDFIYGEPVAVATTVAGSAVDAAGLSPVLAAFRAALGVNNGVSPAGGPRFSGGRREINWDAAGLPEAMPPDFFNNNSKRGAVFSTPGTGFLVSSNSAGAPERLFGGLNPAYVTQFTTNSPNRLFAAAGSTVIDASFFVPARPEVPATVPAFGAVFTDVDLPGHSRVELFDATGRLLASADAPVSPTGGLSFCGVILRNGERAARVRITAGNLPLGAGALDTDAADVVALDDFIYGEPQPMPQVHAGAGGSPADIAGALASFRAALGANNGVSTNGGPVLAGGRREINWDAAGLPEAMPADFFNNNSKRGAVFATPGTGFLVSSNSASAPERLFAGLNPAYATQFTTNSPNRLFAAAGSTVIDATFFVPATPAVPATVTAFGAVFTDVEFAGSRLEYYDLENRLLASIPVPTSANQGLSFAGLAFTGGERIARVRIYCGTRPLGAGNVDGILADVAALDDFIYSEPQAAPGLFTGTGAVAADLAASLGAFRTALGANNGVATSGSASLPGGRREINWDAGALPEAMPADFFNNNSKRGAVFATPGTGFLVSSNSASAAERLFGNLNPAYVTQFTTNSPNRLFTALGSTVVEARFFVPGRPGVPATINAFGAVFCDVDLCDSTRIECFDLLDRPLGTVTAPAAPGRLSFAGLTLNNGERIARVRITSGNLPVGPAASDTPVTDVVVMDDFVYAEPQSMEPEFVNTRLLPDGSVTSTLRALEGLRYDLQSSPDLSAWSTIGSGVGSSVLVNTNVMSAPRLFYRAVLTP